MKIQRQSPIRFESHPEKSEEPNNWSVVLRYHDEGQGPWLVDLCHKERFDLQEKNIDKHSPGGLTVPQQPGMCTLKDNLLINRMTPSQASIYCLGPEDIDLDGEGAYTEVTEGTFFLGLFGPNAFLVTEKLTSLDFLAPHKELPFLYQGPFCHVPSQIVTLARKAGNSGGILLCCSRGYAESMIEAILHAGAEFGLRPAGEEQFMNG